MNAPRQVLTTAEGIAWEQALPSTRSVFGSLAFARITEQYTRRPARLLVWTADDTMVAYPFFLRPLQTLPFAGLVDIDLARYYDTLTPEYTGPIMTGRSLMNPASFLQAWSETCQSLGIIAEFAHIHPWHACRECLDPRGLSLDREIIYVDLSRSLERLRNEDFSYACRKNLRRAEAEGVEVHPAVERQDIIEFHRLYTSTMDRNHALDGYYFPLEYFLSFFEEMPDHACFMMATHRGSTVAGTLYLHDDTDAYSYLGGAYHEYQQMRPSNAVVYETIRWAQACGKQRLILGGGYKPDDGIFRFKSSFSSLRARFSVYRKVHQSDIYARLSDAWSAQTHEDPSTTSYFPVYRAPQPIKASVDSDIG